MGRVQVGFTFGLCDVSVVCALSFEGTLRPSPSTSDVGQSPAPSVTCSVQGRPTGKSKTRDRRWRGTSLSRGPAEQSRGEFAGKMSSDLV